MSIFQICPIFFGFILCLELIPESPNIEYYNSKYIKSLKITIRKINRKSPYYINFETITTSGVGNNITVEMALLEYLSGQYHPTPLQAKYKLCDFLENEPHLGQMFKKQLPKNWTCPFPPGQYILKNIEIHLQNFPYKIPFTWGSYSIHTRTDVEGYVTNTKELVFKWKCHVIVTQNLTRIKNNK